MVNASCSDTGEYPTPGDLIILDRLLNVDRPVYRKVRGIHVDDHSAISVGTIEGKVSPSSKRGTPGDRVPSSRRTANTGVQAHRVEASATGPVGVRAEHAERGHHSQ